MTTNNRNNRDRDPKIATGTGSGFGGDQDRDRWTNSPKGPAPKSHGSAGGGDFERDRAYAEGVTSGDKAEDGDVDAVDPETTNAGSEGAGEDTTTADEVTGPDAGSERYGAARDRERQRTGNIGKPEDK